MQTKIQQSFLTFKKTAILGTIWLESVDSKQTTGLKPPPSVGTSVNRANSQSSRRSKIEEKK